MSKTILVIDDDPVSVALVKNNLAKAGYTVLTAGNGEEGFEVLKANQPDLILLDVEMPKMNGYSFITALRKIEAAGSKPRLPVVILTAHEENEPIFRRHVVKAYLLKPINMTKLLETVAGIVNS